MTLLYGWGITAFLQHPAEIGLLLIVSQELPLQSADLLFTFL